MGTIRGDVREKVRKLLNQAADREGTPEGDVFRDKAFELMARYGLDPATLGDPTDSGAEMTVRDLDMTGAYQRQQIGLLNALARALHCEVVLWSGAARGTGGGGDRGTLIGAARHVERVHLLFSELSPHMLAGAARLRAGDSARTARRRRSFMVGFATAVGDRLAAQERTAAAWADRESVHSDSADPESTRRASLMLKSDAERAREEMRRRHPFLRHSSSKARLDGDAFMHGCAAGRNSDLGQSRMGARRELGE